VDLGTLGGGGSYAVAVNNSGVVVGDTTYGDTENRHAFMYSDGVMRDLGTLGGANSDVSAINDSGVAVGSSELASGGSVAVMYKDGAIIELGNPSLPCNGGCWDGSAASSINNAGKVVGYTTEFNGQWLEPFLFTDGVMHNLNTMIAPGWDLSFALAINDNDQILALGYSPDSVYQYVLLTPTGANLSAGPGISPVPEPRQAASLLAGVVLLGFFAGRQRRLAPDQRICV
jgi:probable HAF family extracellular repeat protein